MNSRQRNARRRGGLVAVAVSALLSLVGASGSSPAAAASHDAVDPRSAGDPCGNVLLRQGQFIPLGRSEDAAPDPRATVYSGINNRGQLVGGYYEAGANLDERGFYPEEDHRAVVADRDGSHRSVDVPGAQVTLANALNDRTQVVGQYIDAGTVYDAEGRAPAGAVHGFLWDDGEVTVIDVPGAPLTQPLGINNHGDVVGAYIDADADPDDPYAYYDTGRLRGFLMHDGEFTPVDFPDGEGTKVSGINDHGQMVGYYDNPDGTSGGFLFDDSQFTEIDPPGSLTTLPSGIDNRGRIVGGYLDPNGINGRGFLWEDGRYRTITAPGERTDTIAVAINERGDILIPADGTYYRQPEIACGKPTTPASPDEATPSSAGAEPTPSSPATTSANP
jgi:uncharacterized membrane protein